ncbi:hypothetical protein GOP47_0023453 [Adiantum capillus-veneris]|uniref:Uncharacterized protein n=1 Tax=Adiantum capillus-veneris TaxID=13818 RepID=A0A9D4U4N9_ADICA|nr:hypothetical protein GOP47_0023453 [Adiantum capillus-veneris]
MSNWTIPQEWQRRKSTSKVGKNGSILIIELGEGRESVELGNQIVGITKGHEEMETGVVTLKGGHVGEMLGGCELQGPPSPPALDNDARAYHGSHIWLWRSLLCVSASLRRDDSNEHLHVFPNLFHFAAAWPQDTRTLHTERKERVIYAHRHCELVKQRGTQSRKRALLL